MDQRFLDSKTFVMIETTRSRCGFKLLVCLILAKLTGKQLQPRIWSSQNQYGEIWWHIDHPDHGQTVHLASIAELQMWLEQYSNL